MSSNTSTSKNGPVIKHWKAFYDMERRIVGRTDYNSGNRTGKIADTHRHYYGYLPGAYEVELIAHHPGEFPGADAARFIYLQHIDGR